MAPIVQGFMDLLMSVGVNGIEVERHGGMPLLAGHGPLSTVPATQASRKGVKAATANWMGVMRP